MGMMFVNTVLEVPVKFGELLVTTCCAMTSAITATTSPSASMAKDICPLFIISPEPHSAKLELNYKAGFIS